MISPFTSPAFVLVRGRHTEVPATCEVLTENVQLTWPLHDHLNKMALGLPRDWLSGQSVFAWSLFQDSGWGLLGSNEVGLVSHLAFWQAVPTVT